MEHYQKILGQYLRILWSGRWWIAGCGVLVFAVAVTVTARMPDVYEAEAILMPDFARMNSGLVQSPADASVGDILRTAQERLRTYNTLKQVLQKSHPYAPSGGGTGDTEVSEEAAIRKLRSNLDVQVDGRSQTITIAFQHRGGEDPARVAKATVDAVTGVFVDEQRMAISQSGETVTGFIRKEHSERLAALEEAERNLRNFEDQHFGELPQDRSQNLRQIRTLEAEIERLETNRRRNLDETESLELEALGLQQQLDRAEKEGREPDGILTFYRTKLAELETQRARDLIEYTASSTHIQDIESQIALVEQKIAELKTQDESMPESSTVAFYETVLANTMRRAERLRQDNEEIEEDIKSARDEIARANERYETGSLIASEYKRLQREVEKAEGLFEELRRRAQEIELGNTFDQEYLKAPLSVEQAAVLPRHPVGPRRVMFSFAGLVAGLALGVGVTMLRLVLSTRIRAMEDLRRLMPGAVLVTVPEIAGTGTRASRISLALVGAILLICLFVASAGILAIREGFLGDTQVLQPLIEFRFPWSG